MSRICTRLGGALLVLMVVTGAPAPADAEEPEALARARALYNAGSYDAAIEAASMARRNPAAADAAALVFARAHIERFRAGSATDDLAVARDALSSIRPGALSARDQVDLLIGLGQTLYLSDAFGASADVFGSALGAGSLLSVTDRARLLDWWATALDREAQTQPAEHRQPIFTRIVDRMEEELRADPGSAIANYWLVAGSRGAADLERAWDAAVAAWVRAALAPDPPRLRNQLDRIVSEALIPELARVRAATDGGDAVAALSGEWNRVKESWKPATP